MSTSLFKTLPKCHLFHRAFHAFPSRTCPFFLPFPTLALTTFYSECVLGSELPGNKVGALPASVLPRACGTGHWGGWGAAPAWSQAGHVLLSAGCMRGPRRPGTRAAGCWHFAWPGCGPAWPQLPCSLQLRQVWGRWWD